MTARRHVATIGAAVVALLIPCAARAQTDLQLWGNFTFDWIKDHRITMGVDAEPKVLLVKPSGDPDWATLDITPSFEYSRGEWFDMIGELMVGYTKQNNDLNTTEVTPRIGFRFHFLSNLRDDLEKEHRPKQRLVLRDLVRLEWRNLYYSTDKPELVHPPAPQSFRDPVADQPPQGSPTTAQRPWRPTGSGSFRRTSRPSGSPTVSESEPASLIATASRGASKRCMSGTVRGTRLTSRLPRATTPST